MKLSNTIARKSSRKNIRGQGMSEYLIIVGLIAVAAIAVMGFFGDTVRGQLGGMGAALGGDQGQANEAMGRAAGTGAQAAAESTTNRDLSNWAGSTSTQSE